MTSASAVPEGFAVRAPIGSGSSAPARDQSGLYRWSHQGGQVQIAISDSGGSGPAWLLLPALSNISSHQEWQLFCGAIGDQQRPPSERPRLIRLDWPGFGDSDRLPMAYACSAMKCSPNSP